MFLHEDREFHWTNKDHRRMNLICRCINFECSLSRLLCIMSMSWSESTYYTLDAWDEASLFIFLDLPQLHDLQLFLVFAVLRFEIVVPGVCLLSVNPVELLVIKPPLPDLLNPTLVGRFGHITTHCLSQIKRTHGQHQWFDVNIYLGNIYLGTHLANMDAIHWCVLCQLILTAPWFGWDLCIGVYGWVVEKKKRGGGWRSLFVKMTMD